MNPTRWKHIAKILTDEGLIANTVDIEPMLYTYEKPFPWPLFLKTCGVLLFLICALLIFSRRQIKIKRHLQAEIDRRENSDAMLITREEEYQSMFEDAPLAFIVWDPSLKIREWNNAAEALFGWSANEVIGKIATDFLVPESAQEKVSQGKEALMRKNSRAQINENYTKDGRVIWCQWHNTARKNVKGEVIEFHSIATDVTDEVYARAELDKERAQAVHANQAKDVLLAHTSHEIRNPLNAIMGFTQMIIADAKDPETHEMAQIILDGAEGMLNILNDLLDASKIDAGKMEVDWKQTDLIKCVKKEAKLFSQLLRNKGLNYTVSVPDQLDPIITDERRLLQILNNLINNAAKFTRDGEIRITLADESPTHIAIRIRDTGIGMDDETLARLFKPYVQANLQTSKEFGGTGIGLSLAKKLAELLQGELNVESIVGTGSRFILLLPKHPNI